MDYSKNEVDFVVAEKIALEVKVQPKEFRENKYKIFSNNYPKMKFSITSFAAKEKFINSHKVLEIYQI